MITRATHLGNGRVDFRDEDEQGRPLPPQDPAQRDEHAATRFLLSSIASCFGQAVLYAGGKDGFAVLDLEVSVQAEADMDNFRLKSVVVTVEAKGPQETLEKIVETAKDYCFVANSLVCPLRHVVIARS